MIMISPAILLVGFHQGGQPQTYEFNHLSISARQFGLGQMPIHLYFSNNIMAREYVNSALEFERVHSLERNVDPIALETIVAGSFCSKLYIQWWIGWKKHLISRSANYYCLLLNPDSVDSSVEVTNFNIPFLIISYIFDIIIY